MVDLTCPDVKKVQQKAVNLAKDDYFVVIIGKENHPEVIAIKANALLNSNNVIVVNSVEEIATNREALKAHKKIGVVIQTTQQISACSGNRFCVNTACKRIENRKPQFARVLQTDKKKL